MSKYNLLLCLTLVVSSPVIADLPTIQPIIQPNPSLENDEPVQAGVDFYLDASREECTLCSQICAEDQSKVVENPLVSNLNNAWLFGADNDQEHSWKIYPGAFYYPVGLTTYGDQIQLDDGSIWYVRPSDRYTVSGWVMNDQIVIKPKACFLSNYAYVLHNKTVNQVAHVGLVYADFGLNHTYYIVATDHAASKIWLSDGSVWHLKGCSSFHRWKVGNQLIIGVNNHWRTAKFAHFLINASLTGAPYSEANVL